MLPKEAPLENVPIIVELVSHRLTVNLHAGGEDDQIVPVAYLQEEKTIVRRLIAKEVMQMVKCTALTVQSLKELLT